MTASIWLDALERRVVEHPVLDHPLLQAFETGSLSWHQVRAFGLAYYPHILRTRLYQASALSVCLDERLQLALASILADEYGHGDAELTHPALYRRFLRGLGWTETDWAEAQLIPALRIYIAEHRALCGGDELSAVACAGLAMEWPIPPLYRKIVAGLQGFADLDEPAIELFTGHMEIDVEHAALVREALLPRLGSASARGRVERAVERSMAVRVTLMDGLWEAVQQPGRVRGEEGITLR